MSSFPVIAEAVYNGRDNIITLVLSNNGVVLTDLSGLTRATVKIDATTTIDSAVAGSGVIWWTDTVTYRGTIAGDEIRFTRNVQDYVNESFVAKRVIETKS